MAQAAPRNPSPKVLTSRWLTPTCVAATAMETNICGRATRCAMRILFRGLQAAQGSLENSKHCESCGRAHRRFRGHYACESSTSSICSSNRGLGTSSSCLRR